MDVNQFLNDLKGEIHDIKDATKVHFSGLSEDQLHWRPQPKSWSIAECLEHLCLTNEQYLNNIKTAIEKGHQKKLYSDGFDHSWFGRQFIKWLRPNAKFNFKAPSQWQPTGQFTGKEVMEDFLEIQDQLIHNFDRAEGLDLRRLSIKSPAFPLLKLRLGEAFQVIVTHQKRHLNQAQGIYKSLDFPKEDPDADSLRNSG